MSIHRLAFAVAALASTAAVHAQVPLADFARHTQYRSVKISPGGDYLAADAIVDGKRHLALIEIANNKVLTIRPRGDDELSDFQWVGPRRVIYSLQQKIGAAPASDFAPMTLFSSILISDFAASRRRRV
jgi:hypothetical protein